MIESMAVDEHCVLRPANGRLPLQDRQTVRIEIDESAGVPAATSNAPTIEEVRRLLAVSPSSWSDAVSAERDAARN